MKSNIRRRVGLNLGLLALAAACGRNVLQTGKVTVGQTVTPPAPVPIHSDGTCDPGLETCPGDGAGFCFDLQSAPNHCGTCGTACAPGIPCENGQCRVTSCASRLTMRTLKIDRSPAYNLQIGIADFDRDGAVDILIPSPNSVMAATGWSPGDDRTASVYRGQADGTFTVSASFPAGEETVNGMLGVPLAVGDLNHDQIPDLVLGAVVKGALEPLAQRAAMSVHLGKGDGTFGQTIDVLGGTIPGFIAVADLDGDGTLDLATADTPREAVTVWHGKGDGTFAAPRDLEIAGTPRSVMVADWNHDGIPDLLAADGYLHVLLGTGQGDFAPVLDCGLTLNSPVSGGEAPVIADFDQDGVVDLATNNTVLLSMHDCNFTRRTTFPVPDDTAFPFAAADLNGDGALDLAVSFCDGVGYLPGDGHGNFGDLVTLAGGEDVHPQCWPATGYSADFDGDGRLDLVVGNEYSIRVFMNTCQ